MDDYNIKRYIPKKYHEYISDIKVECEGGNYSNRSHLVYIISFTDGNTLYIVGVKNIAKKIKKYLMSNSIDKN